MTADPHPPLRGSDAGERHARPDRMRFLTVRQPWAWAMTHGDVTVLSRPWSFPTGTVAIRAAKAYDFSAPDSYVIREAWARAQAVDASMGDLDWAPVSVRRDAIVGTVDVIGSHLYSPRLGCYQTNSVTGWAPFDGSDASSPSWRPRLCSSDARTPLGEVRLGSGVIRHFTLANPLSLDHAIEFTARPWLGYLPDDVAATVRIRLESQRPS